MRNERTRYEVQLGVTGQFLDSSCCRTYVCIYSHRVKASFVYIGHLTL